MKLVFSDVDRTLAFTPSEGGQVSEVVVIPGGIASAIARATIETIVALRRRGAIFCVVTGRRMSGARGVASVLPLDHLLCEHGGVILDHEGQHDPEWHAVHAGIVGLFGEKKGPLWDLERGFQREGLVADSDGRFTSFRVSPKVNQLSEEDVRMLIARPLPEGITFRFNLGNLDFLPVTAGKRNAAVFIAQRHSMSIDNAVAMGDDHNDLDILEVVGMPLTLLGASPEVIQLVKQRQGYVAPVAGHGGALAMLEWIKNLCERGRHHA